MLQPDRLRDQHVKKPNLREEMETLRLRQPKNHHQVKKPNLREEMETRQIFHHLWSLSQVKKPNLREEMETVNAILPNGIFTRPVKKPNLREEMETR